MQLWFKFTKTKTGREAGSTARGKTNPGKIILHM